MKNILRKFLIIFVAFLIVTNISIISFAENESVQNDVDSNQYDEYDFTLDEQLITDEENNTYNEGENSISNEEKNFFSFSSSNVTVDNDVYGDVFICTSGTATIDAYISGNVFICASSVEISENSQITSSLFTTSETLNILGAIEGNVYSLCQNFNLAEDAYIDYDLFVSSKNVNLNGLIYRDANISSQDIKISETAYIYRNLEYSSEKEISIPEGVVSGNVKYNNTTSTPKTTNSAKVDEFIYSTFSLIVIAIIVFAICKWIKCKFINNYPDFVKNLPKYLLYGILGLIVIPIVSIVLLALVVTIPLSVVLLAIYFIFILIASSSIIISIASLCSEKLKEKLTINDNLRTILFIIVLSIIYNLLQLIPIAGSLLTFVVLITGFGLLTKSIFTSKQ